MFNFERERGTKTILGNMEHKKTIFCFGGTSQCISGIHRNRYRHERDSLTFHFPVRSFRKFQN